MADKRFILSLTDAERAKLESLRVLFGLRSHAETVRLLIEFGEGLKAKGYLAPTPDEKADVKAAMKKAVAQKGEKPAFKSRLKGEWKAP